MNKEYQKAMDANHNEQTWRDAYSSEPASSLAAPIDSDPSPEVMAALALCHRLRDGAARMTRQQFRNCLKRAIGASKDYADGVFISFENNPAAFLAHRQPQSQSIEILRVLLEITNDQNEDEREHVPNVTTNSGPLPVAPVPGSAAVEREKRQWWAVADDDVRIVTGYSCAPNNPDMWWCPAVGYSMSEKHHLFETEREAIDKLIAELTRKIEVSKDSIESLKLRRQNAESSYRSGPVAASNKPAAQSAHSD